MKKVFFALLLGAMMYIELCADTLYFMPQENVPAIKELIKTLREARKEIRISIYSFTNREIAKALRDSAARGVKIRVIFDKSQNLDNDYSSIGYLAKYNNITACILSGKNNGKVKGIMHQKMAIIDEAILILGSANWSKSAFENNYETLIFLHEKGLIKKAIEIFEQNYKGCERY